MKIFPESRIKIDESNWKACYKMKKDNGRYTKEGIYEDIFKIDKNQYVISPYYTGKTEWMVGTAEEVLRYTVVK